MIVKLGVNEIFSCVMVGNIFFQSVSATYDPPSLKINPDGRISLSIILGFHTKSFELSSWACNF